MPRERPQAERLAVVETDVKHLLTRVAELDASLQQTVSEFRQALDKHRDHHTDEAREASNTRWRWISALLAVAVVLGPILTYCLPKVF